MKDLPSSPLNARYEDSTTDSDSENDRSNNQRSESNITDDILNDRKLKYHSWKQPLSSSSPIKESSRERRQDRLRELAREKKTSSYRNDMEQFVMQQEYLRHLREMDQEAQKHQIPLDQIDRLIDYEDEASNEAMSENHKNSSHCEPSEMCFRSSKDFKPYDDDKELVRLIEMQEEYELLMAQEQRELEETMSGFTI
ncbi:unnamed protein product [Kluyveromyces dobzhanskii CBS 2104]|uniref:WGS project CCBQ000000000 data, contig 00011 n=1 Tax=Kluyveromyces dobzhanskii CBS 2104 TaxID=1427455 RepID=A0A0A8L9V9_9SACH|nr:unnamed protein product [Kluyveromyces dobzhanskii CBS 2104]